MFTIVRPDATRRGRDLQRVALSTIFVLALVLGVLPGTRAHAHEGHDHNQVQPLNLPIAPRVTAVSPDFEVVGVFSAAQRLTVFVTRFDTNEPVTDARLSISTADHEIEAEPKGDGVFEVSAPWLAGSEPIDIVFEVTLPDNVDLLTGRLGRAPTSASAGVNIGFAQQHWLAVSAAALSAGFLLAWFLPWAIHLRHRSAPADACAADKLMSETETRAKHVRRAFMLIFCLALVGSFTPTPAVRAQGQTNLPSVPATMATDAPQRMSDGTLFVPKATQHLLVVRTILTRESEAPRTVQLVGTVIADPHSFGRVQTGHAGRIEAPEGGLAFVGKRVDKGDLLAYLQHHIEVYNKGNLQGEIAELEERIKLQETKLALYLKAPLAIPPIKIEETKGELAALRQKRRELVPALVEREEIHAPISGIISVASVVAGQVVDAREVAFEIVDPARFWVEAIAHDPEVATNLSQAFAVAGTRLKMPLEFVGIGPSLKQQAAPLLFRVVAELPLANLSIGKPVTVILQSTLEVKGIVLPASSLVRAQSGLPIVWVKPAPERFEPHAVRYEPLDGQRVLVSAGLKADMRVVTQGATLLNQIR
jgi:membrane fusion protein, heavy metal efflux system